MNQQVKIFRLNNDIDIIAIVEQNNGFDVTLISPLKIILDDREDEPLMVLYPWLPIPLLKENKVTLSVKDVIFLEPADDVIEFYLNALDKVSKKEKSSIEDLSNEYEEFISKLKKNNLLN